MEARPCYFKSVIAFFNEIFPGILGGGLVSYINDVEFLELKKDFFPITGEYFMSYYSARNFATYIVEVGDFLTSQNVDIIRPRSSFSIPTSVRSAVFSIRAISIFGWRTPSLMLNREHAITTPFCSKSAFPFSVSSPSVMSFKKSTSTFQCWYGSSTSVFEATNADCYRERFIMTPLNYTALSFMAVNLLLSGSDYIINHVLAVC